jgi:2-hydroxychromene-2-carboxylate isomerase
LTIDARFGLLIGPCEAGLELLDDARTTEESIKDELRRATEQACARGLCGAPSFVVNDELLFWGQDRLHFVERALGGWRPRAG